MPGPAPSPSLEHHHIWQRKPVLRAVYRDMYRRMDERRRPGSCLEIGGGIGNYKEENPQTLCLDIQALPSVDLVGDAHLLPFAGASFDNIVMIDALHHLERPGLFLEDAGRVLREGGRLIMAEPMISPVSRLVYTYFHPEPVRMDADPLAEGELDPDRDPFEANQAIPTLLFIHQKERFIQSHPSLKLMLCRKFGLFAYPLSGGFRPWGLIPGFAARPLLWLETYLEKVLAPLMGFRMLVVIEKISLEH